MEEFNLPYTRAKEPDNFLDLQERCEAAWKNRNIRLVKIYERDYLAVDFQGLELLAFMLGKEITASGFKPTRIVGIARWGSETANRLSMYLGLDEVQSVGYKGYDGIDTAGERRCYQGLGVDIAGDSVLVVDELAQTYATMKNALREHIIPAAPKTVKTAVMIIKPQTDPLPDFWVLKTDKWVLLQSKMFTNVIDLLREHTKGHPIKDVISQIADPVCGLRYPDYITEAALSEFERRHGRA